MSNTNPPTVCPNQVSNEEMARDHGWILQNYYDSLIARGLSANRIENTTGFIERWFERYGVATASGKCPLYMWEAMKPIAAVYGLRHS
ncbi:MAG TPA: hypothetical protein VN956_27425 [Pyrinomonadaceae bacterium]|nr:hypothetical protein [Pyrinomonadaceae bacterium]